MNTYKIWMVDYSMLKIGQSEYMELGTVEASSQKEALTVALKEMVGVDYLITSGVANALVKAGTIKPDEAWYLADNREETEDGYDLEHWLMNESMGWLMELEATLIQ